MTSAKDVFSLRQRTVSEHHKPQARSTVTLVAMYWLTKSTDSNNYGDSRQSFHAGRTILDTLQVPENRSDKKTGI